MRNFMNIAEINYITDWFIYYIFCKSRKGININIDASEHQVFIINGSIFGSGNASSTSGYSYININNYGTQNDVKRNISIQRANIVTLNNSYMELSGATDRTNEYSNVLFTLSRIDELKIVVNGVERNIVKLGSFFASDKEIITIE